MENKILLKQLSKERFEAFIAYTRKPMTILFNQEIEYWADLKERVIGLISLDKIDGNFSIILLARDELKRFRAIDLIVDIETLQEARKNIFEKISEWAEKNDEEYYQHDVDNKHKKINPFQKLDDVDESELNPSYKLLIDYKGLSAAKEIIEEIMPHYIDIDCNQFVKQFQTTGFDQRLWELYLFCFFNENLFERNTDNKRPDFYLNFFNKFIGVEALTIGKPDDENKVPLPENNEEFRSYMRIKFSNALRKKLRKRYWEEPHMKNCPLLLAVADFHFSARIIKEQNSIAPPSLIFSKPALEEYLYGGMFETITDNNGLVSNKLHKFNSVKDYEKAFFDLPDSENISAIIFSNLGTISKFNRMGKVAGFGSKDVKIFQIGEIYNPDPTKTVPIKFTSIVEPSKHCEYWGDGINIYHNPNAKIPLDEEMFPSSLHHHLIDNTLVTTIDEFSTHPFWSLNFTIDATAKT